MELCSKKGIKTKIKRIKIKENQTQIEQNNLEVSKINLNETERINTIINNSYEEKTKLIDYNGMNEIKNIHNINKIKHKNNSSINKDFKKKYSNLKNIFNRKDKFFNLIISLLIKFLFIFCKCKHEKFLFHFSEVSLQINEKGNINIISKNYFDRYKPSEIIINGCTAK